MERGKVLDEAKAIINGERQDQYGNAEDSFSIIAQLWDTYVSQKVKAVTIGLKLKSSYIEAEDVAMMMVLFKIAREVGGAGKRDNLVDACGYLGLAADIKEHTN